MENRIDQIITLDDGNKYMVLDQGSYNQKSYLYVNIVNNTETDFTNQYTIFEENQTERGIKFKSVTDAATLKILTEYFKSRIQ